MFFFCSWSGTVSANHQNVSWQVYTCIFTHYFPSLSRSTPSSCTCRYYKRALGAVVVYDVTNWHSYDSVKSWLERLRRHAHPNIVIMLVGNKCDLKDRRAVIADEAKDFAEKNSMLFSEVSALDGTNVKDAFRSILTG